MQVLHFNYKEDFNALLLSFVQNSFAVLGNNLLGFQPALSKNCQDLNCSHCDTVAGHDMERVID